MPILYLTEAEVRGLLSMDLAIPAVESAFRKLALDEAVNIPRQRCQTDSAMLHVLPAAAKTLNALGFKAYTTGKNEAKFHVYLFDPKVGGLIAILEADYLGAVRTGAASAVATNLLAKAEAKHLGLYGTGKQARTQLEAIAKVRKLESVKVFARDQAKCKAFATEMSAICNVEVKPVAKAEDAAIGCDLISTATSSREPILFGEWIEPGTHINLVGSNFLAKAEADVEVFRRAHLVTVDSKEQAKTECGDFVQACNEGVLNLSQVRDFAPVLVGRYAGRTSPEEVTIFKSLGLGVEDIAVAAKVLELAKQRGVGKELLGKPN